LFNGENKEGWIMKRVCIVLALFAGLALYAGKKVTVEVAYAAEVSMDASLTGAVWQKARAYPLLLGKYNQRDWPKAKRKNIGNKLRNPGYVKFLRDEVNLYVGVMMEDGDVVAEGVEDQTHLYQMGDTIEVFLKPAERNFYWEIYGTPNLKKSVFFYPGRGRLFVPSSIDHPVDVTVASVVDGTLNDCRDQDRGWSMILAIPVKMLEKQGYPFRPGHNWTVLVARQNYSADLPLKEYSMQTPLTQVDFHLYEEYGDLVLLPSQEK